MNRAIVTLSDDLASQIAAGEVVERPASVVKELIENALDAGASRVDVTIEGGGISLIEVSDDGHGMGPADASRCLGRHATSKLRAFRDLEEITSYGFRGEALPSVASVSRLELRTRSRESEGGVLIVAHGTTQPVATPIGIPVGTTVSVRDLFYNVPARRKFLRASNTESGHVGDVVVDAALSRPDVSFTLTRDGRKVKAFPRVGEMAERVVQVFAEEAFVLCEGDRGPLHVSAYLSEPARARKGAGGLKLFVNSRPVVDRSLAATIAHAYGELIDKGRYPRGAVFLRLPGRLVDVNAHPQKTQVRFVDARAVLDALHGVVARALQTRGTSTAQEALRTPAVARTSEGSRATPLATPERGSYPVRQTSPPAQVFQSSPAPGNGRRYALPGPSPSLSFSGRESERGSERGSERRDGDHESRPPPASSRGVWRDLRFLGQARQSFLVCEGEAGIYVLDQHAAHERVILAEIRAAFLHSRVLSQSLLFPETMDLTAKQGELVTQHGESLGRLGLDVRVRSECAATIHSVPRVLARGGAVGLVKDVLAHLETTDAASEPDFDDLLARLACREAVKPAERLTREIAENLLRQMTGPEVEPLCRHGRVIVSVTPLGDLERRAGRL